MQRKEWAGARGVIYLHYSHHEVIKAFTLQRSPKELLLLQLCDTVVPPAAQWAAVFARLNIVIK